MICFPKISENPNLCTVLSFLQFLRVKIKSIREGENLCELVWSRKALFELDFEERGGAESKSGR